MWAYGNRSSCAPVWRTSRPGLSVYLLVLLSLLSVAAGRKLRFPRWSPRKSEGKRKISRTIKHAPRRGGKAGTNAADAHSEGWLAVPEEVLTGVQCGVDKDFSIPRARRASGGIITAVLSCGLLIDWLEIFKGESLQLVYALLYQVVAAFHESGLTLHAVAYDNACKLLHVMRAKRDDNPPVTRIIALLRCLLDAFHRGNHTWCLEHLPEVDPERPENAHIFEDVNTEACEQLNSWINGRTLPALEFPPGQFLIYWWALFDFRNAHLLQLAAAKRRRFAAGALKHDPDRPQHKAARD